MGDGGRRATVTRIENRAAYARRRKSLRSARSETDSPLTPTLFPRAAEGEGVERRAARDRPALLIPSRHALRPRLGRPPALHLSLRRQGGHFRSLLAGVAPRQGEADRGGRGRDRRRAPQAPALLQDDQQRPLRPLEAARPARRVLFLIVLTLFVLSVGGSHFERTKESEHHGVTTTTRYTVDLDSTFLSIASVLLVFLLGMELVDKINYRDELELARDLQASLIPKTLPSASRARDRRLQPDRQHRRRRRLRLRAAAGRRTRRPLRGRVGPRDGGRPRHGRRARRVPTQLDVDAAPTAMFATLNRILCRTGTSARLLRLRLPEDRTDGAFVGSVAGHPLPLLVGRDGSLRGRLGRAPTRSASRRT